MAPQLDSLDEAWTAWLEGRTEAAIRRCVALLEADASQDHAAALLVQVLAGSDAAAKEVASDLVDVFIDRGELADAVVMARVAGAGLDRVAAAFGAGSPRLADVSPAPPALPPAGLGDPKERGEALVFRAFAALRERTRPAGRRPVPTLPLFSALAPAELEPLLAALEVRGVRPGDPAVLEGEEGTEAYVVVRGYLRAERMAGEDRVFLAELGPGAIFGEMALVSGAPRAASVRAVDAVQLLAAPVKRLEALSETTPAIGRELSAFCRARMISNLLLHSRILGAVADGDREALVARFTPVSFAAGDLLVRRGDEAAGLLLIASGHVRVVGADSEGDEVLVAELGPGDVVGEIALVLRRPATADVVATHDTVALRLTAAEFKEAIRAHPSLLAELYELATKRDEEMRSVVAQEALDVEEVVLL